MKTLAEWLARKPKGPAPKRPLPRVTPKRAKQNREYSVKRKAFLLAHPYCQIALKRLGYSEEDAFEYDGNIPIDWDNGSGVVGHNHIPRAQEIHHSRGRGKYFLDESTWLAASRTEHQWAHQHPKEARAIGVLF